MFKMFGHFVNFFGALILLKICILCFALYFGLIVLFMGNSDISEVKQMPIHKMITAQSYIKVRSNLLLFYGKIIPLRKSYFPKLSKEEELIFPDPKKALFKFNAVQQTSLDELAKGSKMFPVLLGIAIKDIKESI